MYKYEVLKMNELYDKISNLCADHGISVGRMCSDLKISRGNLTDLKMGRIRSISSANLQKIADYFSVSLDFFSEGEKDNAKKAPTLNKKDERDIKKKMDEMLEIFDSADALMFDGEPLDEETRQLLRESYENQLRITKQLAKAKFTPKKYKEK